MKLKGPAGDLVGSTQASSKPSPYTPEPQEQPCLHPDTPDPSVQGATAVILSSDAVPGLSTPRKDIYVNEALGEWLGGVAEWQCNIIKSSYSTELILYMNTEKKRNFYTLQGFSY